MACCRFGNAWVFTLIVALCAALYGAPAQAAPDPVVRFDEKTGLFEIKYKSFPIVTAVFGFWRDKWRWIGPNLRTSRDGSVYSFKQGRADRPFDLNGRVERLDDRSMVWRIEFQAPEQIQKAAYGGIRFLFNTQGFDLNGAPLEAEMLPGKDGWRLQVEEGQAPIEVRFDRTPPRMYFEPGRTNDLRAFFINQDPETNLRSFTMTVTMPPGGKVVPSVNEAFAEADPKTWLRGMLPWNVAPVDLSFLNTRDGPAGSRGFVRAEGDRLVFEDGTPARFWGTNLTAYALFATRGTNRCEAARRIAKFGFNLVRFTHHDSVWVNPNVFGAKSPDTRTLSNESLRKLDWWIHCLKQNGIYVWLDLHVGRRFTRADGIDHFDEMAKGTGMARGEGFSYVNESMQDRLKEFNEAYLNRVNTYTGLAYKDDPAVLAVLITNENDLTHHYGNGLLPDKNVPEHNKIYMARAREFADKFNLSANQTWRSWTPGPSKLFLSDLEHRFNREMMDHLQQLGVRSMIATTNTWGGMSMSGLFSLTDGDVVDVHSYATPEPFHANNLFRSNFAHWIAAAQVEGMPVTVTEWEPEPFPVAVRTAVPPYLAALSAFQGWDALMQYAYTQNALHLDRKPARYQGFNDPAIMALMPAAALMYREGHVSPARKTYALTFGDRLHNEYLTAGYSAAIRTLAEQSRVVVRLPRHPSLPWLKQTESVEDAIVVSDPDRSFLPEGSVEVTSDTGELTRNWTEGVFRVDTPKTQMAAGWIGGKSYALADVTIETEVLHAAIAVQSLTGAPISGSDRILVSLGAQAVPDQSGYLSEPVPARITVRAPGGLSLFGLMDNGRKMPVPVEFEDGVYTIRTDPRLRTWWYMLEKAS